MQKIGLTLSVSAGLIIALMAPISHAQSLMEIYHLAISNDPQLKAATARLNAAKEAIPQSTSFFLPQLSANASYSDNDNPATNASTSYGLSLTQSIYNHRNFVQRRTAKNNTTIAELEFQAAKQDLIRDVAKSYFNVLSAHDNLKFAQAEKQSNARQLDQTQQRFDVGLVAITDVHVSRAAYDISVAQAIEAENNLDNSKESLREITGLYHDDLSILGENMPLVAPSPNSLNGWTERALNQNITLKIAEENTIQAREAINAQQSDHYPTVNLSLSHSNTENGINTSSNTATISMRMSLYRGGNTSSRIRQTREFLKVSRHRLEQTRRTIQRTVRNAYRGVLSGISRVTALRQALVSTQSALRAADAGYEVGTRTAVDVLAARRNVFSAQRDYARARYDYILNTLNLQKAGGSLNANNLKTINDWLQ